MELVYLDRGGRERGTLGIIDYHVLVCGFNEVHILNKLMSSSFADQNLYDLYTSVCIAPNLHSLQITIAHTKSF
jgi:hypothetical protein